MCGIAGLWDRRGGIPVSDRVAAMAATLRHRGPDDLGSWSENGLGLGHTRLAVIDLSPQAAQPMADAEQRAVIVFNGEIYNFRELRTELKERGHRFFSHSDTEVVLNGYLAWGTGVFARLRGMFALAIHDRRRRSLILARDRIGKKPLYYHDGGSLFAFGSEIKAILVNGEVPRTPDLGALHDYLTLQYTPTPSTAFRGIYRLPPAHFMEVQADGRSRMTCYWRLPHPADAKPRKGVDLAREFLGLVEESVRLRMVSDVPVGALLSGGVDSSTVVAFMARNTSQRIKTFSVGFDEEGYDETVHAAAVSDHLGTEHHVLRLSPDCTDILPRLAWHYGEPFADPSAIATYLVSRFARDQVTVVLTGDGGDESMLGYPRYLRALEWGRDMPRPGRLASSLYRMLPAGLRRSRLGRKMCHEAARADQRASRRYAPSIMYFMENEKEEAYGEALRPYLAHSSLDRIEPYFRGIDNAAAGAAWADLHTYLPDDLLVKVDVASMAWGLEARAPLLDHTLLEWAARLGPEEKMPQGELKGLFKASVADMLPRQVLYRPKMGFGVPVDRWLSGSLKPMAYDLLTSPRFYARGLVRRDWMEWALEANSTGRVTLWHRIWALMVMELWFRTWIDGP